MFSSCLISSLHSVYIAWKFLRGTCMRYWWMQVVFKWNVNDVLMSLTVFACLLSIVFCPEPWSSFKRVTGPAVTLCSSQEVTIQELTKAGQRIFQLIPVDGARVVPIITTEAVLPVSDILPQRLEFLEVDGSWVVTIKHPWKQRRLCKSLTILQNRYKVNRHNKSETERGLECSCRINKQGS